MIFAKLVAKLVSQKPRKGKRNNDRSVRFLKDRLRGLAKRYDRRRYRRRAVLMDR